jgi:hypothetical protein
MLLGVIVSIPTVVVVKAEPPFIASDPAPLVFSFEVAFTQKFVSVIAVVIFTV